MSIHQTTGCCFVGFHEELTSVASGSLGVGAAPSSACTGAVSDCSTSPSTSMGTASCASRSAAACSAASCSAWLTRSRCFRSSSSRGPSREPACSHLPHLLICSQILKIDSISTAHGLLVMDLRCGCLTCNGPTVVQCKDSGSLRLPFPAPATY